MDRFLKDASYLSLLRLATFNVVNLNITFEKQYLINSGYLINSKPNDQNCFSNG